MNKCKGCPYLMINGRCRFTKCILNHDVGKWTKKQTKGDKE